MSTDLEVRSFRSVFALERRIYRIDTLRLNPSGIPLRGIGYAATLVIAALIAGAIPPTAWLDPLLPWYARDIGIPVAGSVLLGAMRVDGRPFHTAAAALVTYAAGPRTTNTGTPQRHRPAAWRPPSVLLLPDGSDARFRRLRYRGPGAVLVTHPHIRSEPNLLGRADVTLRPLPTATAGPEVIELAERGLLDVMPR